jgi:phasin
MPTQPKAPKSAKPASVATPFDAFNVSMPSVEIPTVFRDLAEKSIAQARDTYTKMKSAAEEATTLVEDTYETAREGAFAIGVKALDAAKENSDASFAFAHDLFGAKTFAEVIELQTGFARKQFDAYGAQIKALQELTQKYVTDTAKPVTAQVEKSMKDFKAA